MVLLFGFNKKINPSKKNYKPVVKTRKSGEEKNNTNNIVVYENSNQKNVPDTASSKDIVIVLVGIVILGSGILYIYRCHKNICVYD